MKVLSAAVIGNVGTTWSVAHTGDYSGIGKADILSVDTSGNVAGWFMNGTTVSSIVNFGNIGTSWAVQSINSE